jgi:hypothetical protein
MSDPNQYLKEDLTIQDFFDYLDSRLYIKRQGFKITNLDSRIMFKMRHNVFKSVVSYYLGIGSSEEKSFASLGLGNSNRTPDFITVYENVICLIEYTVTNMYSTAIQNKESFGKYDPEVNELRGQGYIVYDYYLCLSLDQDIADLYEIILQVSNHFSDAFIEDLYQHLSSLKEDFFYANWYINDYMPELLLNNSTSVDIQLNVPQIEFPQPFKFQKRDVSQRRGINIFLRRKIRSKLRSLQKSFTRRSRSLRFKLVYNVASDTLYTAFSEDGLPKSEMMNLIQTEDEEIFAICEIHGGYDSLIEPFKKYNNNVFDFEINDRLLDSEVFVDDNGYSENIYNRLRRVDEKTLADCSLAETVDEVSVLYSKLLSDKNSKSDHVLKIKKNPFIFVPTAGITKLGDKVIFKSKFYLTGLLLQKAKDIKNNPSTYIDRKIDYDVITNIESKSSKLWSKIKNFKDIRVYTRSRKKDLVDFTEEQFALADEFLELRKQFSIALGEQKSSQYSNRVSIPMSVYKTRFKEEMEHFGKDKAKAIVYPETDIDSLVDLYRNLIDEQFIARSETTSDSIFSDTDPQGLNLSKSCSQMRDLLESVSEKYRRTDLAHTLQFISNMSYSLMYYSNIKLNKNDFCIDTMGYKNCLMIVRGGKKITSTRRSRLFKVIFPISPTIRELISTSSIEFVTIDSQEFAIMPWRQLKQDYLKVGMELYSNFSNYYISSYLESNLEEKDFQMFSSIKILAMFSQKRKLEIWLSNFRYLYFNSTGNYSQVLDLVESMIEYDYDSLFYLLQRIFYSNYKNMFQEAQQNKIFDILWSKSYDNFDLAAEKFDEAIFMTKSPVDNYNEHLLNLRSVLETHDYFWENYQTYDPIEILQKSAVDMSSETFDKDLYADDFKFDPKLSFLIGENCAQNISTICNMSDVQARFSQIMSESYTDIKTSRGMRDSKGSFWGKKGFDVIFDNSKFSSAVVDLVNSFPFSSRQQFERKLRDFDVSFASSISEMKEPMFEFDVKDKIGAKGRREIYVMTENAKILQQPIERMMKFLCSKVPNELIHKKSHIRPKIIHQKIFETKEEDSETVFCTLDCRKWAPRSNIWKYLYFIIGMKKILPDEFIVYFLKIWMLMFKKRVRIQKHYIESLKKNPNSASLCDHLVERSDGDFELIMPYSFMMGIYNYLSSLFHAASQNYFNITVAKSLNVKYNLLAHSDDSGGTITGKTKSSAVNSFRYYEHFQKCCNHLMSRKKSVLSYSSFEIISIMYSRKRLIPMTYKFITNISFNPSGAGWYTDICSVVSIVVDIFHNGGSYLQSYSAMLAQSELLRKAYHLPRSKMLSAIPLHFGGVFNMHPIHIILLGSCAQEVMLDVVESNRARNHRIHMYNLFNGEYIPGRGSDLTYRIPYIVKHKNFLDLKSDKLEILSNIALINEKRTLIDSVKYFNDLRKNKFEYSLLNIDTFKLLFATLFFKVNVVKLGGNEGVSISDLARNFVGFQILGEYEKTYFEPYSNEISYMRSAESISIDFTKNTISSNKSCKPLIYNTFVNLGLNISYDDLCCLTLHNSGDNYKILNKNPKKWESLTNYIAGSIPGDSLKHKMKILTKLERNDLSKTRSAHLFIPSNINIDTTERFWTFTLLMCSRRYYISSQKPQFYTLEQFEFWKLPFDCLKHHYFLMKLAIGDPNLSSNIDKYKSSIVECRTCEQKQQTLNTLDELVAISRVEDYGTFETDMPFAIYKRPQMRSSNVWFGTSDFILYTKFGKVEHYIREGRIRTDFFIYENNFLDQIWHLYKIFCDSRGIEIARVTYGNTGEQTPRISFSDLNIPYISTLNTFNMILEDSRVYQSDYETKIFKKVSSKVYFNDETVDFNIYNIYDINDSFFKNHNLKLLRDQFIEKTSNVNKEFLINSFRSSKIYNVLSLDSHHKNYESIDKKYKHSLMLGSPGSLTRALCLANESGMVKYKSSVDPKNIDLGVLEHQNISQIPIIDLYRSTSFLRVNHFEYLTLTKISNNEELDIRDLDNLERMVKKTGLATGAQLLVSFKEVFKNFDSSVLNKITVGTQLEILKNLIDCVSESMEDKPVKRATFQYTGSKRSFWNSLKTLNLETMPEKFSVLMTKALFRSQSDNLKKFWEFKRKNPFTTMMNIHHFATANIYYLISTLMRNIINAKEIDKLELHLQNSRHFLRAKKAKFDAEFDFDDIEVDDLIYKDISNYNFPPVMIDPNSDDFEDLMDAMNENDELEEECPREYDDSEEPIEVLINTSNEAKMFAEYSLTRKFSQVKIYSIGDYFNASWLGPGNYYLEEIDNVQYSISEYPGKSNCPKSVKDLKNFFAYKSMTAEEIYEREAKRIRQAQTNAEKDDLEEVIEETLGESILEAFKANNLIPTPLLKRIIPEDKPSLQQILEKVLVNKNSLIESVTRRKVKNYLPGFSGIIRDPDFEGELRSLFGENYHYIVTGQLKVKSKTAKTIRALIKNMFMKVNVNHKSVLIFLMSMLKETIDEESDAWFTDEVFSILSDIDDQYGENEDEKTYIAPDPGNHSIFSSEITVSYEAYDSDE